MSKDSLPPPPSLHKSKNGRDDASKLQQPKSPPPIPPSRVAVSAEVIRRLVGFRVLGLFCVAAICFSLCCCCFFLLYHRVTTTLLRRGSAAEVLPREQGSHGDRWSASNGTVNGEKSCELPDGEWFLRPGTVKGEQSCDLSEGEWVWDDRYPLYQSRDCPFLDGGFRCMENGRPDSFYTKWRWQPKHCDLPRFRAESILDWLRNKRVVFVGDSLGRNHWESLLCLLAEAVPDKSSIHELDRKPITKHDGFFRMRFDDYNCTVEYYRAPYLVAQGRKPRGARVPENVRTTLRLDRMDWTASRWRGADVLIFNTGHWWNYEKTIKSGCYFQVGRDIRMNMTVDEAHKRSIQTLLHWIKEQVDTTRTQVVYRSYSPVHFRGADWRRGGNCHMETHPRSDDAEHRPSARPWDDVLKTFVDAASVLSDKHPGFRVELLNVTEMTDKRHDGHPSLYYLGPGRPAAKYRQDCSHWCLPGIPDAWNELLFALLLNWENRTAHYSALWQKVESTLH